MKKKITDYPYLDAVTYIIGKDIRDLGNCDIATLKAFASWILYWFMEEDKPQKVCVRCGREYINKNLKHTRLYGDTCICGGQEWTK